MAQIVTEPFKGIVSGNQIFPSPTFLYFPLRLMVLRMRSAVVFPQHDKRELAEECVSIGFGWSKETIHKL
jgi:hypothetical protein